MAIQANIFVIQAFYRIITTEIQILSTSIEITDSSKCTVHDLPKHFENGIGFNSTK